MSSPRNSPAALSEVALAQEVVRFVEHRLGCAPSGVFDEAVLRILSRSRPGDFVAAELVVDLFDRGAQRLALADFGLAFAEWVSMRDLGPLAQLWEHYPTLADLLKGAERYLPLSNSGVMFRVERSGAEARIVYALTPELRRGSEQFMEATLVLGVKVARNLLGPTWRPLGIELQHSPLSPPRRMHECFRAPVRAESQDYAIVFPESDLHVRHGGGDEVMAAIIQRFLDERVPSGAVDLAVEVKRTISWLLRSGSATLEETATVLALKPRTLQRKLRALDADFAGLLADVRAEITLAYLARGGDQPIGALANLLGYSEPSAVSRFLKQRFGDDGRSLRRKLA